MIRSITRAYLSKSVMRDGEEEVSCMLGACADASRGVGVGGDMVLISDKRVLSYNIIIVKGIREPTLLISN